MHIPAFVFFGFTRRRLALHAEAVHAARELSHGFGTGPGALGRAPTSYHDRSAAAERLGTAPARKRLARTAFRSLNRAQTAIGEPRNSFCFPCVAKSTGALEAVPHTRSRRGGRCGCRRRRHCKQRAAALSAVRVTRKAHGRCTCADLRASPSQLWRRRKDVGGGGDGGGGDGGDGGGDAGVGGGSVGCDYGGGSNQHGNGHNVTMTGSNASPAQEKIVGAQRPMLQSMHRGHCNRAPHRSSSDASTTSLPMYLFNTDAKRGNKHQHGKARQQGCELRAEFKRVDAPGHNTGQAL